MFCKDGKLGSSDDSKWEGLAIILGVAATIFLLIAIGMVVYSRYKKKRVAVVQEKAEEALNTGMGAPDNVEKTLVKSACSFPPEHHIMDEGIPM